MLALKRGGDQASARSLDAPRLAVGRDVSNDIVLNEPSVSGFHALILRENERFIIADLGSTNGCFVNGQRISGRAEFSEGDKLGFGTASFDVARVAPLPDRTVVLPAMAFGGGRAEPFVPEMPPPLSAAGDKFCAKCGTHAAASAGFCVKCGQSFAATATTADAGAGPLPPEQALHAGFSPPYQPPPSAANMTKPQPTSAKKWVWAGLASAAASVAAVTGGWLFMNKPPADLAGQIGQPFADTSSQAAPLGAPLPAPPPPPLRSATPKATASARPAPVVVAATPPPPPMLEQVLIEESYSTPLPLALVSTPEFIVAPSDDDYIYMAAGVTGLYFLGGQWYRHHEGHWFGSHNYNGRWSHLNRSAVPASILRVPPEYSRRSQPDRPRIHYAELDHSWRNWDQKKHWNNHTWYKNELRDDGRRNRPQITEREHSTERHGFMGAAPVAGAREHRQESTQHVASGGQALHFNQAQRRPNALSTPHQALGQAQQHHEQPRPVMQPPQRPHNMSPQHQEQPRRVMQPPQRPQNLPQQHHEQPRPVMQPPRQAQQHQEPPRAAATPQPSHSQNHQGSGSERRGDMRH